MIKLERGEKPKELTDERVYELTNKFKKDKSDVWRKEYIVKALALFSHNKCCYCETTLGEESKYLTVDHFHHKDEYPDEVVEWNNLLPCCSRCNSKKGKHNTYVNPIINPAENNPQEYLYFENYRYKSKNDVGRKTIGVLNLNNTDELVIPRFRIGDAMQKKLEQIYKQVQRYENNNSDVEERNEIIESVADLLKLALPDKTYSGLISTIILNDKNYEETKIKMKKFNLWNDELQQLEDTAKSLFLSKYPLSIS